MSKLIKLTRGKFAIVDDDDFDRLNKFKWYAAEDHDSHKFYAVRSVWNGSLQYKVRMHSQVMNAPKGKLVDHVDSNDTLNNQKANLRFCTNQQNLCNRGKPINNTSGFKGVAFNTHVHKWQAQIRFKGETIYLGVFVDKTEAARAYDQAALKYHGEFAKTNLEEPR